MSPCHIEAFRKLYLHITCRSISFHLSDMARLINEYKPSGWRMFSVDRTTLNKLKICMDIYLYEHLYSCICVYLFPGHDVLILQTLHINRTPNWIELKNNYCYTAKGLSFENFQMNVVCKVLHQIENQISQDPSVQRICIVGISLE